MNKPAALNWVKAVLVSISVLLATIIVSYFKIDYGFFSVITSYVLIQVFLEKVYTKTIERIVGPCIAFIFTFFIIAILHNHFVIMLISSAILSFLFIYFYSKDHFSYAMLLGGVTVSLMSAMAYATSTAAGIKIGIYWVINIVLASFIVMIVTFVARKWLPKDHQLPSLSKPESFIRKLKENLQLWKEESKFNYISFLIASRVTLTVMIIILVNETMGWSAIDLQAVIAGTVVSAQLNLVKTYLSASLRILGVIIGAMIAILYAHILQLFPSQILLILMITLTLGAFSLFGDRFEKTQYAFLQAGMMLPIILLTSSATIINTTLAWQRTLGSLEGGIIGIIMVYISLIFLKFKK